MDRDDCNLDLKVEVNISSECSLSSGECLHRLDIVVQTCGEASSSHEGPQSGKLAVIVTAVDILLHLSKNRTLV